MDAAAGALPWSCPQTFGLFRGSRHGEQFGRHAAKQRERIALVESEMIDGASHVPIVRATLREVLLEGLEDVVHFGEELTHYERTGKGTVIALFSDGTTAIGDVLVGADGTGSEVRKQYLPQAQIADTGIVGAASRLPIIRASGEHLPEHLLRRLTSVLPPKGTYMIVTQSIYRAGCHEAINAYEKAMAAYGFAAVRRSAWFGNIVVSDSRLLRGTFKTALRLATRTPL